MHVCHFSLFVRMSCANPPLSCWAVPPKLVRDARPPQLPAERVAAFAAHLCSAKSQCLRSQTFKTEREMLKAGYNLYFQLRAQLANATHLCNTPGAEATLRVDCAYIASGLITWQVGMPNRTHASIGYSA